MLKIANPHLHDHGAHVMNMGLGKLSARLDLRQAGDAERLRHLIRGCDVFSQSFPPERSRAIASALKTSCAPGPGSSTSRSPRSVTPGRGESGADSRRWFSR